MSVIRLYIYFTPGCGYPGVVFLTINDTFALNFFKMKRILFIVTIVLVGFIEIFGQSTFSTSGDWNTASNWTPASVPTGSTTAIDIANNTNPTVSTSGSPHVIGSVAALGKTTLTVDASSSLTLGSQADFDLAAFANLTLNNNSTLTVDGSLIIYGDLVVNNTLTLNITGTFIVYGNVILNNNADIVVSGSGTLTVDGSLTGGTNTNITTSGLGTIAVTGDIAIATGTIDGEPGSIAVGGTCAECTLLVLPIELLYFSATENDNTVLLNWATATEENFDYFEIERAIEGTSFDFIGEVKGDGNSLKRLDYSFIDDSPEIGLNYYRLKSIDLDGTFEYSDIVLVRFTSNVKLLVSPNPTLGIVSIKTSLPTTGGLNYEITSQYGVVVLKGNLDTYNSQIDLRGLPKGLYIIRLVDLPTVKAKRIILK